MGTVAIAYVLHKAPFVFPVLGGRKPEQIVANIEALDISLSDDQIAFLDTAKPLDPGFPNYLIVSCATSVTKLIQMLIPCHRAMGPPTLKV